MGETRDLFKKIGNIKGIFHAKMRMKKDRSRKDLTEIEAIQKRWQECTELYKEGLNGPNSHNGVVTHTQSQTSQSVKPSGPQEALL